MREGPKIKHKVLHSGNSKQNAPVALAVFHESTSVALTSYFPEKKKWAKFLKLFTIWWIISSSKVQFLYHILGHGTKKMTGSQNFLIGLTIGIMRGSHHLSNSLFLSVNCRGSETNFKVAKKSYWRFIWWWVWFYDFTLRPLRQMSGARFLVGLKDTIWSEKFWKSKVCWKRI